MLQRMLGLTGLAALGLTACAAPSPAVSLFNGKDLTGWTADVPDADDGATVPASFGVENGLLMSYGEPQGHLVTDASYRNYRLEVEYRWPGDTGNCGVLVHCSTPRRLYGMFPQSIECQLYAGNAGDFWCIGENIETVDMETRRGDDPLTWGVEEGQRRRILNLTDDSENPPGEWNLMTIECQGNTVTIWINGDLVNEGFNCTASGGRIAIQAEGTPMEFRRVDMWQLPEPDALPDIALEPTAGPGSPE